MSMSMNLVSLAWGQLSQGPTRNYIRKPTVNGTRNNISQGIKNLQRNPVCDVGHGVFGAWGPVSMTDAWDYNINWGPMSQRMSRKYKLALKNLGNPTFWPQLNKYMSQKGEQGAKRNLNKKIAFPMIFDWCFCNISSHREG